MSAWITADWPAPPRIRAVTTTRHGLGMSQAPFDHLDLGLRNGDDVDVVRENRRLLEAALGLPSPPRWLRQVHGLDVVRIDDADAAGHEAQADAAVTSTPGMVLAILTADCLPMVVAARDGSEVAAAHAGWKGLSGGVLEATVGAMHASPDACVAWLGPAAGPSMYEIGEDVRDAFLSRDARAEIAFVPTRPGHWRVDLYAIARQRLADAGVREVHGGTHCTITESQSFFSHRRDQRTGRMATLAWITP